MTTFTIRYAETDEDVVAIHRFLCILAGPLLPGDIDPKDSATEVWRVAREEAAIMVMERDRLVGTAGIIQVRHWWNTKLAFMTNRWMFAIPGVGAWRPLLKEAKAIAAANDLELFIISEARGRTSILNRSPKRAPFHPLFAKAPVAA